MTSLKNIFLFGTFLSVLLIFPKTTFAQGISVSPSIVEMTISNEIIKNEIITITNNEEQSFKINLNTSSFSVNSDDSLIIDYESAENFTDWFSFPLDTITIPAKSSKEIPIELAIPKNTPSGGYYPIVLIQLKSEQIPQNQNVGISFQFGIPHYITIENENSKLQRTAEILDFSSKGFIHLTPQALFTTTIRNKSKTHIKPIGSITIYDPKGIRQSNTVLINEKFEHLLPEKQITEIHKWKDETINNTLFPPIGTYKAKLELYLEDSRNNIPIATSVKSFYVLPYHYIFYITLLAGVIVGIFFRIAKNRKTRQ
ncbi:hypothetical protein KC717_00830 [Candidatus Dojkabacteria bacterium]|uniref:DUF916 domain-containing protein n=1 Tax=Candidatus Dojkabacteria bacterium TaxID=2099670 RepID=A0A955L755_9BACT|nr:hypothetical protein [Candidatus Dojkabacteria bacterium]